MFNKVAGFKLFSGEYCGISKNNLFHRTYLVAAFIRNNLNKKQVKQETS